MPSLITYTNTLVKPYYKYILAVFFLILFIVLSAYVYNTFFVKMNKNKNYNDVANTNNSKPIMAVYFFHVDWCPHCIKAQPDWQNFMTTYNNKLINGYILKCYDIDCTEDNGDTVIQIDTVSNMPTSSPSPGSGPFPTDANGIKYPYGNNTMIAPTPITISNLVKKYNIDSYPTVKLTKDNIVVEYQASVTQQNLVKFVNSV